MSTPIYAGGRIVGRVVAGTFSKTIHGSKHFLRQPPAIGFDVRSLGDAQRAGAVRVDVFDRESKVHYVTDIDRIFSKGFRFNRGFGDQIALPLDRWQVRAVGQPAPDPAPDDRPFTLPLFGGLPL